MRGLADLARQRIVSWMAADPRVTQTTIAKAVGVSQGWVSQYKTGDQDADIDQLAAIASVFGHTLHELVDLRPSPKEQLLLDAFRRIRPEAREVAVKTLEMMAPPAPRGRTRGRTDER